MFRSASKRELATAIEDLRARSNGDLLRLRPDDVIAAGRALAPGSRHSLLPALIDAAISDDSARLAAAARAFGREMVPPARLVASWALSIGVDPQQLGRIAASAEGPVLLVGECLKSGPIALAEMTMLRDVAAAYADNRDLAPSWINIAVEREIDRYASLARQHAGGIGLWQRLCRSLHPGSIALL